MTEGTIDQLVFFFVFGLMADGASLYNKAGVLLHDRKTHKHTYTNEMSTGPLAGRMDLGL